KMWTERSRKPWRSVAACYCRHKTNSGATEQRESWIHPDTSGLWRAASKTRRRTSAESGGTTSVRTPQATDTGTDSVPLGVRRGRGQNDEHSSKSSRSRGIGHLLRRPGRGSVSLAGRRTESRSARVDEGSGRLHESGP